MKKNKLISSLLICNFALTSFGSVSVFADETTTPNEEPITYIEPGIDTTEQPIVETPVVDPQPDVPLEPQDPSNNEVPTDTVEPTTPEEQPGTPEAPVESDNPTTPEAPVEDDKPATPEAPTEDDKPTTPEAPVEGDKPATPEAPVDGDKPTTPEAPAEGDKPATPEAPVEDDKPVQPESPTKNEQPTKPEAPIGPVQNEQPTKPETPVTPETPTNQEQFNPGQTEQVPDLLPRNFNSKIDFGSFEHLNLKKFKLSPSVLRWTSLVEDQAKKQGMSDYVPLILAIIQVESGGAGTRDIMQSSESAGHGMNYFTSEEQSVKQGISYLKRIVEKAEKIGNGYQNNIKVLAQSYNFGIGFLDYLDKHNAYYNVSTAAEYSKTVVAPSLGNHTGQTYKYSNSISKTYGNEFLYRNGGNFYYGNIVSAYIYPEFSPLLMAIEEFQGQDYVWGGKNPTTGFDCSGLISWALSNADIDLPSYTVSQWDQTEAVDPEEAQPGDLIFFKGTYGDANFISHVGFYIDNKTMFDSNSSGVGYHNWDSSYWQEHFAGIRRVPGLEKITTNDNE